VKITVGIVDYGVGNHSSVRHALGTLGFRCRVSDDPRVLDACNLLVLPGVGAFKPAMEALRARGLDRYLLGEAGKGRPLLGICLGMQLLAERSYENGAEPGLALVPGEVRALGAAEWHIGWNTIDRASADPLFEPSFGRAFYFNHSYVYDGPREFHVAQTVAGAPFASAIRRGSIVGLQFHPEKSQADGRALLERVVAGLCGA
jgi:imidazole glycerol phosphate synthase glutamine amidotransferase subunit